VSRRVGMLLVALLAAGTVLTSGASAEETLRSRFVDPDDGWLDVSGFLDTAYGFVPVASPITEPAVGYGAAGGLIFIDRNPPTTDGQPQRPNLAAIAGLATENGTWGALGGWSASWLDGRLQTLVGAGYASINLDFFGVGKGDLNDAPAGYNVEAFGGMAEARYRILRQPLYAGLRYTFASTNVSFDNGLLPAGVKPAELDATLSGLTPILIYDTRDSIFTPTTGLYLEANAGLFSRALGGDFDFQNPTLTALVYHPLGRALTLGVKANLQMSFGDMPFYLRPGIVLRGVEARRYLGEHAAEVEAELRWQFSSRFSVVGFVGVGSAWTDLDRFKSQQTVVAGGTGVRYLVARRYGLHMGVDVGFGPDGPILYVQFGSAWFRP
jgi:outer membrane protein assembly factor BamA